MPYFPSIAPEGFGNVTLEAWRVGRPVIVSNRGALPEVVTDGRNGLVFDPEDPMSLQRAVALLRDEEGVATAFGAAGRQEVMDRYAMDAHLARLENVYEDLMSTGKAR